MYNRSILRWTTSYSILHSVQAGKESGVAHVAAKYGMGVSIGTKVWVVILRSPVSSDSVS